MPEQAHVTLARPRQVLGSIISMTERRARDGGRRVSTQVNVGVAHQGKNRMIEGRRRQLDLSTLGSHPVFRDDTAKNLELHLAEFELVFLREVSLLPNEALYTGVAVEIERIDPGELVPYLQIEKIGVGVVAFPVPFLQQLGVTRIQIDHAAARRMKKLRQDDAVLSLGERRHGLEAEIEMPVPGALLRERLELHEQ